MTLNKMAAVHISSFGCCDHIFTKTGLDTGFRVVKKKKEQTWGMLGVFLDV